jgi:import inner membrane translocase subunit TIM17
MILIIIFIGSFALWGGLFSLTDCTLMHLRNKEDYLNPIAAGFLTGGFLAIRGKHLF